MEAKLDSHKQESPDAESSHSLSNKEPEAED
jgi:hypothetical protein